MKILLTSNESQVMNFVWDLGRPVSRQEILMGIKNRTWSPSSIHIILNSLQSKGVLRIANEEVYYGRTYEASMSRDEYIAKCATSTVSGESEGEKALNVVAALVNTNVASEEAIDEIQELLNKRRRELLEKGKN